MIEIAIPGKGEIRIKNIVFDVNGTIASDGKINERTKKRLKDLNKKVTVFLLTSDTYGTIEKEMGKSGIKIKKISHPNEAKQKEEFIKKLGGRETIAIGNGENDSLMLKKASLGICIIEKEGASAQAIKNADIVIYGKGNGLGLLENPTRIIATLRE